MSSAVAMIDTDIDCIIALCWFVVCAFLEEKIVLEERIWIRARKGSSVLFGSHLVTIHVR